LISCFLIVSKLCACERFQLAKVYRVPALNFSRILTMSYQIFMVLANLLRGHSGESFKLLRQMALTREADL
jgi:hypothetical protein